MMRYLIDDVGVSGRLQIELAKYGQVLSSQEMTGKILQQAWWQEFDPATTLLVFPGNGSDIVREFVPINWLQRWRWTTVTAKRCWTPGEDPVVTVGRIFSRGFILGLKDVVLLDDVISSGQTVRKLRLANMPWIPGARWHAATWVAQKAANLQGFESMCAIVEVGERNRKDPINSLSTLIAHPEIAESYARRNFPNPVDFLSLVIILRQEVGN